MLTSNYSSASIKSTEALRKSVNILCKKKKFNRPCFDVIFDFATGLLFPFFFLDRKRGDRGFTHGPGWAYTLITKRAERLEKI